MSTKAKTDVNKNISYSRLFRRFVLLTILCSIVPLLIVGWGIQVYYTNFAKNRMTISFHTQTEFHRNIIELFLKERIAKLQLLAGTHSKNYFLKEANINKVFAIMNNKSGSISDMGIIDDHGDHLAYVGPYELMGKNYFDTVWFKKTMEAGIYISDMFMGFRNEPHFIIAVAGSEDGKKWIIRATIDTETFRALVENVKIGKTGEVYLLNQEGVFQTSSRFSGKIMTQSSYQMESVHEGIEVRIIKKQLNASGGNIADQIVSHAWLSNPRWMLVVKQDYSEAFNDVNHANYATIALLVFSSMTILLVTVYIAKYMIATIKRRDTEANHLNSQLMQAGKLASIGELSAGVAHEINNPLAIILTEKQILLDLEKRNKIGNEDFKNQFLKSMGQVDIQIKRCKHITQNLLRFARRTKSVIETVDINAFILEIVDLMEREARTSGIKFLCELETNLPDIQSDPSQLQQVFLNIINNSIDAHESKPYGGININTQSDDENQGVLIEISDTGSGIPPEYLEKIFDPFFTTKTVGKGTGLGLSICYSIIKQLGGDIAVRSEHGKGAEFIISLPCNPPLSLQKQMEKPVNINNK